MQLWNWMWVSYLSLAPDASPTLGILSLTLLAKLRKQVTYVDESDTWMPVTLWLLNCCSRSVKKRVIYTFLYTLHSLVYL